MRQLVKHRLYYFGHLHMDKPLFRSQIALYREVYRLWDGERLEPVRRAETVETKGIQS